MAEEIEITEKSDSGSSYPSITIDSCISILKLIYESKGDGFVSLNDIAIIVGKAKATMILRVSACVQYGLLKNVYKKGYCVTKLFISIVNPEFENLVRNYTLEAFGHPALYKKLITRYNGNALPNVTGLASVLASFGIHENSKEKAANVFLENCKSLGISDNGRLRYIISNNISEIPAIKEESAPYNSNNDQSSSGFKVIRHITPGPELGDQLFNQPIDLGERTAFLQYPRDITADEIDTLKIMVDASIKSLELRRKKIKNPAGELG